MIRMIRLFFGLMRRTSDPELDALKRHVARRGHKWSEWRRKNPIVYYMDPW